MADLLERILLKGQEGMSIKRLTKKESLAGNNVHYVGEDDCFDVWSVPKKFMGNAIDRLAVIEDILGDDYDLDRLRELVEADRDGRCVVLPCKVGDSLWILDRDNKPREMELDAPDIRCHCREEDNLCMVTCSAKGAGVCAYRLRNDGSSIGRILFLTREAAEAAQKAMEQDG